MASGHLDSQRHRRLHFRCNRDCQNSAPTYIPGNYPLSECRRALTPEGKYVLIGHEKFGEAGKRILGLIPHFFKLMFFSLFVKQLPKPNFSMPSKKDAMAVFREFLEAGKITPVIDRAYPLTQASEAIRYLMEGEPRGRVVITP